MESVSGLFTALFLPWLVGWWWLQRFWPKQDPLVMAGYGYFFGILMVVVLMLGWSGLGLQLSFWPMAATLAGSSAFPLVLGKERVHGASSLSRSIDQEQWRKWLWWFLVVLIVVRYGGLLLEVILRPLYPWDAFMNWSPKARVWFELKEIVPFVDYGGWAKNEDAGIQHALPNSGAADYPPLVPLVQAWTALGLNEWRDNWINLPWWLCGVAFLISFYAQLRSHTQTWLALLATYLVFSMPYLNVHVALPGYADLWMAAFYCMGVMALYAWSMTGSRLQGGLVLAMAIGCILTKRPGLVWAVTLFAGAAFVQLSARTRYILLAGILVGVAAWIVANGFGFKLWEGLSVKITPERIELPYLGVYQIEFHDVTSGFYKNLMARGNWHLMGWSILLLFPLSLAMISVRWKELPAWISVMMGGLFLFVVFFYTSHYVFAMDSTTINRALLHWLPAAWYLVVSAGFTNKRVIAFQRPARPAISR